MKLLIVLVISKKLSNHISVKLNDDISFLSKQYERLTFVSPRSVLSSYLDRKAIKRQDNNIQPIFPFGFNISQKTATEKL